MTLMTYDLKNWLSNVNITIESAYRHTTSYFTIALSAAVYEIIATVTGASVDICVWGNLGFTNVVIWTPSRCLGVSPRKILKMLYAFMALLQIRNINLDFI